MLLLLLMGCGSPKHLSSRPVSKLPVTQLERHYGRNNIDMLRYKIFFMSPEEQKQHLSAMDQKLKNSAGHWRQINRKEVERYADLNDKLNEGYVLKKSKPAAPHSPYFDVETYDRAFPGGNIGTVRFLERNGMMAATSAMEDEILLYQRNEAEIAQSMKKKKIYAVLRSDIIFDSVSSEHYGTSGKKADDKRSTSQNDQHNPVFLQCTSPGLRYHVVGKIK